MPSCQPSWNSGRHTPGAPSGFGLAQLPSLLRGRRKPSPALQRLRQLPARFVNAATLVGVPKRRSAGSIAASSIAYSSVSAAPLRPVSSWPTQPRCM